MRAACGRARCRRCARSSRKVALPARHRQLLGQVAQQRVRNADIALRVLEVDRFTLCGMVEADLARLHLLAEIAERDVAPQVAVEVEQHAVRARVSSSSASVVRLDLRGVGVELEPEAFDEAPAEALPVEPRYAIMCAL